MCGLFDLLIEKSVTLGQFDYSKSDIGDSDTSSVTVVDDRNTRALAADESTYKLETFEKNAMIIFNQYYVNGYRKPRVGTKEDGRRIKQTLQKFGFEGDEHMDLTKAQIFEELKNCKSVFVVLLNLKSHIENANIDVKNQPNVTILLYNSHTCQPTEQIHYILLLYE